MWKRARLVGAAAVLGLAALSLLSVGPLLRCILKAQAARRGLVLAVQSVRPSLFCLRLSEVTVRFADRPGWSAQLRSVELGLTPLLSLRSVRIHGGSVRIAGSPREVVSALRRWQTRGSGAPSRSSRRYSIEGLDLVLFEGARETEPVYLWGLRYERATDGWETLSADLARAAWAEARVEALQPELVLRREENRPVLERLTVARATLQLRVDHLLSLQQHALGSSARGPSAWAGWKAMLSWLLPVSAELLRDSSRVEIDNLRLVVRHGGDRLALGPMSLRVTRGRAGARIEVRSRGPESGAPLALRIELPFTPGRVKAEVDGGPVTLGALGVAEGSLGLVEVDRSELEAKAEAELDLERRIVSFSGRGRLRRLNLEHPKLAPGRLRGIDLGWRARAELDPGAGRIRVAEAEIEMGEARVVLKGELERGPGYYRISLSGGIPLASCQGLLDSAPEGLLPLLRGVTLTGTLALEAGLELDSRHLSQTRVRFDLREDCRISSVPESISPRRFRQSWEREVLDADGQRTVIRSGPGSPQWVSRAAMSEYLETALLICEDGRFFRHRGFDPEAIRNSLQQNLVAGRLLRGASTITMQLAKNLYLGREKTWSRKLQEAVLTRLLEQYFSKDEIIELYLNLVEFGPGVYGIGPAAAYYFGCHPGQLTLGQALYLGSILSNPKHHHFGVDGRLRPGWAAYLRRLMRLAHKLGRIDDQELARGLGEEVVWSGLAFPGEKGPRPEVLAPDLEPPLSEELETLPP